MEPLAFELRGLVYNSQNEVTTMDRSDSEQVLGKTTDSCLLKFQENSFL